MRLIDADALAEGITKSVAYKDYEFSLYADSIIEEHINSAPTIQAIPIDKAEEWKRQIAEINDLISSQRR